MKIRVKLYARLDRYLPEGNAGGASRNEADLEVADGATPADVFDRLGLPAEYCHLVLINGVFVAPSERGAHELEAGDHLAVWPPVAGGGKTVIEKEMALTHADFFRTLPRALGTSKFRKLASGAVLADGKKRLAVALGPEGERRIAGLAVPATRVTLTFTGYGDAEAEAALKRFERSFQKGGG